MWRGSGCPTVGGWSFPRLGDGWDRAVGASAWLTREPDDTLRVAGTDGSWWSLAADGTLTGFGSGPAADGNLVRLVRDEAGRLVRLEHGRGHAIDLGWDLVAEAERIVRASSSDGREIAYDYDSDGRLTGATGPLGTRSYRWAEFGGSPGLAGSR